METGMVIAHIPAQPRPARRRILPGMARFEDQDLTDAEFRECDLTRARLIGVVMQDAVIDGLVRNLVVNGVEVMSYVEAELDRRHPVRLLIRSADPADLREALGQLRADWAATLGRLRGMPEGSEHQRVGGEWSAVETLRHLVFVHDSWFRRCCLGSAGPFTAMRHALIHGPTPGMKLIHLDSGQFELFDLATDPEEKDDLAGDKAKLDPMVELFRAKRGGLKEIDVKPIMPPAP